ncbi:MAG: ABC transporter substrate-binding protein, partial [Nitrosomonadaceae bacterium]|nr:ABC transporter substrate-binding protein [Nitrosomonadaceae bacterium]
MKIFRLIAALSGIAFAAFAVVMTADAKTLRWSSAGDFQTADPHSQNSGVNNNINGQVFEGLVERGKKLEIVPRLATSWRQTSPTTWVFNIRRNVKFHNGNALTADDVVWSFLR